MEFWKKIQKIPGRKSVMLKKNSPSFMEFEGIRHLWSKWQ
jgi:hypothetical protein